MYASADDVATRLNVTFTATQAAQAEALLADVGAVMRRKVPGLAAHIAAGRIESDLVRGVACGVAMLAIDLATAGPAKAGETHPEYAVTIRAGAVDELYLTDEQVSLLTPDDETAAGGRPFSIRPG